MYNRYVLGLLGYDLEAVTRITIIDRKRITSEIIQVIPM